MKPEPFVSIVITNYNYARFLREAIDSAVSQTYSHTEVIVVDDGSTDASREIITSYGARVVPVLKQNGGLTSAINAGLVASQGELICWLDSDDVFLPNKVEVVADVYQRYPQAALIYHKLQIIDADGVEKHQPWPRDVWVGSVKDKVVRSGGWWPRPTTSAMAFPRSFLERLHPMPECSIPGKATWPDAYAGDVAPFCGDVVGLPDALTRYRLHGKNNSQTQFPGEVQTKQYEFEREQLQRTLRRLGIDTSLGSIDRHLGYAQQAYSLGRGVSVGRMLWLIATCPFLRFPSRIRESAKLVMRRH
jgi:glycosyltransferase involved in cell wall biosynthesis